MEPRLPIWVWVENGLVVKAEVYSKGQNHTLRALLHKNLAVAEQSLGKQDWVHKEQFDWFTSPGYGVACFEFEPKESPAYA